MSGAHIAIAHNRDMDASHIRRKHFDVETYVRRVQRGPCFVCALLAGDPDYAHPVLYEDADVVAFLARDPTLLGYSLVCPKRHVEDWVHELTEAEFLRLQRVVRRVALAVAATVATERTYALSLGSQQGNAHVHWHVAPLPPAVAYGEQQFHALMAENGVLDLDDAYQLALAEAIRAKI
jgi:diadenosine tetraphosphate (Ap4A) HIT family hydrolase